MKRIFLGILALGMFCVSCKKEEEEATTPETTILTFDEQSLVLGDRDTLNIDLDADGNNDFYYISYYEDRGTHHYVGSDFGPINATGPYNGYGSTVVDGKDREFKTGDYIDHATCGPGKLIVGVCLYLYGKNDPNGFFESMGPKYCGFYITLNGKRYYGWLKMVKRSVVKLVICKTPDTPIQITE